MPTQRFPNRMDPLHDRLTVVSVEAGQQSAFSGCLARELADEQSAVDLTSISVVSHADIAAVATRLAAERVSARAAALDQAQARLDSALEAADVAVAWRDTLTVRVERLDADTVQCESVAAHGAELNELVVGATVEADARRHDVEAAQQRLDRVLEQRRAGRAAVEGAEREIAGDTAAANRLWDQVEAVRTALDEAETAARYDLEVAIRASSVADNACDRNATLLATAGRRAHDLAATLPVELRPALGPRPLDGLPDLAAALREHLDRQQQELTIATAAVVRASEDINRVEADLQRIRAVRDEAPSYVVIAEALTELLARRRSRWVILEGAIDGIDAATRRALLQTVTDASAHQALIVLTDDTSVLGWAVDLPSEAGIVTTTAALAAAGIACTTEPETEIDHPTPVETAVRGFSTG